MNGRLVVINCADEAEAEHIARSLVGERLAGAANVLPGVRSFYRWQQELAQRRETLLFVKTTEAVLERLMARAKELHSYECPCIVSLAIERGYPPYLRWLEEATDG